MFHWYSLIRSFYQFWCETFSIKNLQEYPFHWYNRVEIRQFTEKRMASLDGWGSEMAALEWVLCVCLWKDRQLWTAEQCQSKCKSLTCSSFRNVEQGEVGENESWCPNFYVTIFSLLQQQNSCVEIFFLPTPKCSFAFLSFSFFL